MDGLDVVLMKTGYAYKRNRNLVETEANRNSDEKVEGHYGDYNGHAGHRMKNELNLNVEHIRDRGQR